MENSQPNHTLSLKKVRKYDMLEIERIYSSYQKTFPIEERRSLSAYNRLFTNPRVFVYAISQQSESLGYFIVWQLNTFSFLEHFEIYPAERGRGLGSTALNALLDLHPQMVLEIVPPESSPTALRRLLFYQNAGFEVVSTSYKQPAYQKELPQVPLFLLANYPVQNTATLEKEIHQSVYAADGLFI